MVRMSTDAAAQEFAVVVGAAAPLVVIEQTLRESCNQLLICPLPNRSLAKDGAEATRVVFVEIHIAPGGPVAVRPTTGTNDLVRYRQTPSAMLRRLIARAASRFGSVRLLVCRQRLWPGQFELMPRRNQTLTLARFLRSGRVVPEDTLIHIVGDSRPLLPAGCTTP